MDHSQPKRKPIESEPNPALMLILTALVAMGSMSVSMYLPSLPMMTVALHASSGSIKMSLTAFLFFFAFTQLLYGPLSDRFGRKPPIVAGILIYIAGSAFCAVSTSAPILIGGRIVQALGAAAGPALGRAVARDLFSGKELTGALATIAAAVALSPMLGPVAGGYLQAAFGWRATFYVLTGSGVVLLLATLFVLSETNTHRDPGALESRAILRNYGLLLRDSEYLSSLLCGGLLTAGNFAWTAIAPFLFAKKFGFSPTQYGDIALIVGGGYVLGTVISGRLSKRIAVPALVYSGLGLSLLSGVVLGVLGRTDSGYLPIIFGASLFTVGMGIVIPMAASCALSLHPEIAGSAAGLLGSLQIFTGAVGTFVAGFLPATTLTPTAYLLVAAAVGAFGTGYIALLPFRRQKISAAVANG